ncbi:hypothetical protein [Arsenicicoccus dermatophilus]|uniref:hypothetical protein n=1 Tax=Arsenicicoccus dermatophilus TaxID=1076331 RepID=UPI001F4CC59E|nr:hypothetical protein [Arsenicicoccus dermatophilus]MCH8611973.1 hypothetical protein [Arsenicicoccus dermatophilus]
MISPDASRRLELRQHARRIARPTTVRELPARSLVVLAAVALAVLLAVAGSARGAAGPVTVGAVAVAFAVLTAGWTRLVGLPSRKGTVITVGITAVLLLASVALPRDGASLRWVPAALALGVVSAFLHQLLRRDGRPRVVTSLSGTLLALALLASGVTWVAVPGLPGGERGAQVAGAAVAVTALVEWLLHRARRWPTIVPGAVVAGTGTALVVAVLVGAPLLPAGLLGVACSGLGLATRALMAPLPTLVVHRAQLVSGVASVLVCGPAVEMVTRHLLG